MSWSGREQSATAVFYACGRSIIVNDSSKLKNCLTLSSHTDRINFTKAINNFTDRQVVVSGGSDSRLIIWETKANSSIFEISSWSVKAEINLSHSVSFASVCEFSDNLAYLIVGNIMGDIYLFRLSDETATPLVMLDSIKFGHHFT
jgi:WD40 repeat protein